jgi:hypothetical protein
MAERGQRRVPASYTRKPWPCCGSEAWRRPADKVICPDCTQLMDEARAARAAIAAEIATPGGRVPYGWTSQRHGWPRYYDSRFHFTSTHDDDDPSRRLEAAFMALVGLLSTPAPADTPSESPRTSTRRRGFDGRVEAYRLPWDMVIDDGLERHRDKWSFTMLVLMDPAVRDALSALHASIKDALADTYTAGKERGSSVLQALAAGEASMADYNAALEPPTKRR